MLTGHTVIDAQHRELFKRLGQLQAASRQHRSREEIGRLLEFLGSYVEVHFATEEEAMLGAGYPGLAAHRAEHQRFTAEMEGLRAEYARDGAGPLLVIRVGNRVTAWLREHISRTDRGMGEWLREHGGV
ncbi:MAG: bacteriohemerythrin [Anaeromyxobacter sp.]